VDELSTCSPNHW